MSLPNPYAHYQHNAVQNASPGELLLMLYDGLVKFLKLSIMSIEKNDISRANDNLKRSQEILKYLNDTLDESYDLSKKLSAMYDYMIRQLIKANIKKDKIPIEEVLGMIEQLRDSWRQAVKITRSQG